MARVSSRSVAGLLIALVGTVIATLIRSSLNAELGGTMVYTLFGITIMVSGWYGGLWPALGATVLGGLAGSYFIVQPAMHFGLGTGRERLGLAIYLLTGTFVSVLCESLHGARRRLGLRQRELEEAEIRHAESELQSQVNLENMGDALNLISHDERLVYMNPAARRLFVQEGLDPDALLGQRVWDKFPELEGSPPQVELRAVLRERLPRSFEFYYPPWHRWFIARMFPSREGGVAVHLTDTTDIHRLQRDLEASAARLMVAVEAANLGPFEWNIETGVVTRLGELPGSSRPTTQYSIDEMLAMIHPDDRPAVQAQLDAIRSGASETFTSEHRTNDNAEREWCWHRMRGRVLHGPDGTPLTLVGVSVDINEHKRLEEALREADRRKDDFLATLAHELRNPLAPIRNATQLLTAPTANTEVTDYSRKVIDRQVAQMTRLLDDLLDVNRIARNTLELRRETTSFRSVFERAMETSLPLIHERGHEIAVRFPNEAVDLSLSVDPVRLAQVFSNLLNNAAKYTNPGGQITVLAERQGSDLLVAVRDTGMGIAADQVSQIFEMFARGPGAQEHARDGLGIGLSLARSIVHLHGGRLDVSSGGPGHGATFTVRLPISLTSAVRAPAGRVDDQPARHWRLVVADDLKDNADSLSDLLRLKGHEVETAYDGMTAVQLTERFRPDAVILDIGMPKMDGYECCRELRSRPGGEELIIVALTGWGQETDRIRTQGAGFDAHLVKPVDYGTLIGALAGAAGRVGGSEGQRLGGGTATA